MAPRVTTRARHLYGDVEIDVWPCDWNLSPAGQEQCREILDRAARATRALHPRKSRPIQYGAGKTTVTIFGVDKRLIPRTLRQLLAVLEEPGSRVPLDRYGQELEVAEEAA
jgi:hypothetical protein